MMQNGGKEGVDGGLKKLLGVFAIIPVIVMFNFMYIAKVIHNIKLPVISIIQIITVINFLRGFFYGRPLCHLPLPSLMGGVGDL